MSSKSLSITPILISAVPRLPLRTERHPPHSTGCHGGDQPFGAGLVKVEPPVPRFDSTLFLADPGNETHSAWTFRSCLLTSHGDIARIEAHLLGLDLIESTLQPGYIDSWPNELNGIGVELTQRDSKATQDCFDGAVLDAALPVH